jgi:ATP-binding cassette, subfamily F, member 3
MRAALARTLLSHPDFLLLDEPTNYLDIEARLWLSGFLRGFSGGVLIVSHDRAFLDDTATEILELFLGKVRRYKGGYSSYETQRKAEIEQLMAAWENQQRDIAKQEDFIRRFRAKATKAKQVQSRVKMLEKQERIQIPEHLRPINLKLPPATHSGNIVLEADGLSKSYDANAEAPVLDSLNFTVRRGAKLAVLGRNGAGKSTLLRILAGKDVASSGALSLGQGVQAAYFGQDTPDTLPGELTILEYASSRASTEAQPMVRDVLGAFLFGGDAVEKRLGVLSGGERSRLAMATLLLRPANLLILDEPTNHLDMTSQEVLAGALRNYSGTVVFVSHDRFFIREVANEVLALWPREQRPREQHRAAGPAGNGVPSGRVPSGGVPSGGVPSGGWQLYPGSYREFEKSGIGRVFEDDSVSSAPRTTSGDGARAQISRPEPPAGPPAGSSGAAGDFYAQKARKAELRKLRKREEELLVRIEALEQEHRRIQEAMASPEVYLDPASLKNRQTALVDNETAQGKAQEEWEAIEKALGPFSD